MFWDEFINQDLTYIETMLNKCYKKDIKKDPTIKDYITGQCKNKNTILSCYGSNLPFHYWLAKQ
jgi:hypothetical protein